MLWYDTFNPNHIPNFFEEPPGLCPNGVSFFKGQWKGLTQTDIQPPKWRTFRASQNARPSDDAWIGNPQSPLAGTLLYDAQRHDAPNTTENCALLKIRGVGRACCGFCADEDSSRLQVLCAAATGPQRQTDQPDVPEAPDA